MVQMKKILENFVMSRYRPFSQKAFSNQSFTTGIFGYFFLLGFILLSIWADGAGEVASNYLRTLRMPLILMIVFNIIGLTLFNITKLKKYAVVISYLSGVLFLFFIGAFLTAFTDNPLHYNIYGSIFIFIGWIIGVMLHVIIVNISLKQGSMKIRDKYGDYYVNILGGIGLTCMFYYTFSDKDFFLLIGIALTIIGLLVVLTFNFPRILPYWRKEQPRKDISVYSDSIKIMKRGKSK